MRLKSSLLRLFYLVDFSFSSFHYCNITRRINCTILRDSLRDNRRNLISLFYNVPKRTALCQVIHDYVKCNSLHHSHDIAIVLSIWSNYLKTRMRRNDKRAVLYKNCALYICSSVSPVKPRVKNCKPLSDLQFDMRFRNYQLFQIVSW